MDRLPLIATRPPRLRQMWDALREVEPRCVDSNGGSTVPDHVWPVGGFVYRLALGHVSGGKLGGESSFSGKANRLWLWQNDIGGMIVEQILERAGSASRAA